MRSRGALTSLLGSSADAESGPRAELIVPIGNLITEATGTWSTVLYTVAGMDILAALCAVVLLKPVLRRHLANA
jgi:hypothetical protein